MSVSQGSKILASDCVSTNTASTLVLRDSSGNFSAGTITSLLTSNRTTVGNYIKLQQDGTESGRLELSTLGAANTEGLVNLILGNSTAKTAAKNASGQIQLYNSQGIPSTISAKYGVLSDVDASYNQHYIDITHCTKGIFVGTFYGTYYSKRTAIGDYLDLYQNDVKCGSLKLETLGPANTEGIVTLTLGNSTAKTAANNASGKIQLYNSLGQVREIGWKNLSKYYTFISASGSVNFIASSSVWLSMPDFTTSSIQLIDNSSNPVGGFVYANSTLKSNLILGSASPKVQGCIALYNADGAIGGSLMGTQWNNIKTLEFSSSQLKYDQTVWATVSAGSTYNGAILYGLPGFPATSMISDPSFKNGLSAIGVYNNASNGRVSVTRYQSTTGYLAPGNDTQYGAQITLTCAGDASPGYGGWYHAANISGGNRTFIMYFRARSSMSGYAGTTYYTASDFVFRYASNAYGTDGTATWLCDNRVNSNWTWYAVLIKCGTSGSFSSIGFIYVTLGDSTAPRLTTTSGGSTTATNSIQISYSNIVLLGA